MKYFLVISFLSLLFLASCEKYEAASEKSIAHIEIKDVYFESLQNEYVDSSFMVTVYNSALLPYLDLPKDCKSKFGVERVSAKEYMFVKNKYLEAIQKFANDNFNINSSKIKRCLISGQYAFSIDGCTRDEYLKVASNKNVKSIRSNAKISFSPMTPHSNINLKHVQ